jgi:demethylsterigmatocystin 6-O-methyltransferase
MVGLFSYRFDMVGPCFQALPDFLQETQYADPQDMSNCAFQRGFRTDLIAFAYMSQIVPEKAKTFARFMQAQRDGLPTWIDVYPIAEKTEDMTMTMTTTPGQKPLFIDLGGGVGHESRRLRQRYPDIPGQVIVLDMQIVIDSVPIEQRRSEGVEYMVHDFFAAEPVKGE